VTTTADAEPARLSRHPWTLQRRLIVTVISIVSLILVLVAVAMSTILGSVLEQSLNSQLSATVERTATRIIPSLNAGRTAAQILEEQPQPAGSLLVVETISGGITAAVTAEDFDVVELDEDQISQIVDAIGAEGPLVVSIEDVGTYRLEGQRLGPSAAFVVGLSRGDVAQTIGQMLTTIALLTLGGLLLLGVGTAWSIRAGLAPLRAVADTAERVARLPLDQGQVTIADRVPAGEADPRTEVGRVGEALNELLDHVSTSLEVRQRNEERMRAFVADASHELRTPLASIRGYSELSLRDPTLSETTHSSLDRIQAQSLRMTTLVEDLLLLARLDEGQELVYGSVDLTRLAIDAVGDAQAAGRDHVWKLDLDEEPVVVAGDAGRLNQVIGNLLANARVHTPAGTTVSVSVERAVEHSTGDTGEIAVVRVHDDGPGIDPALSDELFERFSRADRSRARKTGGTGLGLSIARAIAQAHGGTLTVRSAAGDTTFELRLPAARPADPADGVATDARSGDDAQ
jgi:two-component system OmpR family sensor kinase